MRCDLASSSWPHFLGFVVRISPPLAAEQRFRTLRLPCAVLALVAAECVGGAQDTASFTFATQTLTVPAGFTVELVAAPPRVNRKSVV